MKPHYKHHLLTTLLCVVFTADIRAQGTAFTYQGRLDDSGNSANGIYDLRFTIYNAVELGDLVAGPLTNANTAVNDGLFTVTLDFGANVFDGADRWLEIGVRTNGAGAFTTLTPRQALTATPYAITAGSVTGLVPAGGLAETYGEAVEFTNPANAFAGDGSALNNVDAVTLDGLTATQFWQTGGNAGTTPGTHFVGTSDNQPLEVRVNNQRALRLEPAIETPNVLGGNVANSAAPGVRGSTIAGGGLPLFPNQVTANFATVGGGTFHIAGGSWATIAGGRDNRAYSESSTVAGGWANNIQSTALGAAIGGGEGNQVKDGAGRASITGGFYNVVDPNAEYATIGGGRQNLASGANATIGGGAFNATLANNAAVGGGVSNTIQITAHNSVIGGGWTNTIGVDARYATVGGGLENAIGAGASNSVIGGGRQNIISSDSRHIAIGGGLRNTAGGSSATVGGGIGNTALGFFTTVSGGTGNTASSTSATVGGGSQNTVSENSATVSGGFTNTASALSATVGGGGNNIASGNWAAAGGTWPAVITPPFRVVWVTSPLIAPSPPAIAPGPIMPVRSYGPMIPKSTSFRPPTSNSPSVPTTG